ncbi:MAG: hypothetical protein JWL72_4126 [Ilumatobacteraceae bacterium]|nr:hypothetical protein [Ilumatobacteraceae bacterium]
MQRIPAPLLVVVTVVLWAAAFPAIRVGLETMSPVALSFFRLAMASAVLCIAARMAGAHLPRRADLAQIALCGATGMAAYQLLLNVGERQVQAGTASVIIATAPVYSLIIASVLLGERLPPRRWWGLAIAMLGSCAVAVSANGRLSFQPAAIAVLLAALVQGMYHAAQRPLLSRYTPLETATYAMVAGALMLVPTLPWSLHSAASASARSWIAVVALAIGPSALGFVAWAGAVARMEVSRPALALYAVPVVAIGVSWAWLGEHPKPVTILAGGVALIGVAVGTLKRPTAAGSAVVLDEALDVGLVLVALSEQPDPQELRQ